MQPQVALLVCSVFICGVLLMDRRQNSNLSAGLWIPVVWVVILASRPLVLWFDPNQGAFGSDVEDGSAIDRAILAGLMAIAAFLLFKRNLQWGQWVRENPWLILFFVYCGISVLWSEFLGVAFKRWIRAVGSLMMILVVLSERDPIAAMGTMVRRCAYVLVPLSVLVIKYYRGVGAGYNQWTGGEMLVGITTDKNALGRLCLISGIFVLWDIVTAKQRGRLYDGALNRLVQGIMLLTIVWLLVKSHSATSLASFLVGAVILIGLGLPLIRRKVRYLGTFMVVGICVFLILDMAFNVTEVSVNSLSRDMTFTERTYIWNGLLEVGTNPVVGVGYDSFWLGERLERFLREYQVNEAHNGYLEVYLELGAVGLVLLAGFVVSSFRKAKRSLLSSFEYGRLRMVLLIIFLLYNITEAEYKATTLMCFVLILTSMEFPRRYQN